MLHTQHFTLEEAGKLLDELKPVVIQMVKLKQELDAKGFDIYSHQYFGGLGSNGTGVFPEEMDKFVSAVKIITMKGILIKGIDDGLIDFLTYVRTVRRFIFVGRSAKIKSSTGTASQTA